MRAFVASEPDEASVNQRKALLASGVWEDAGAFEGRPAWRCRDLRLVSIGERHLDRDLLDRDLEGWSGERVELVVYLSKHRSESRTPSLTVHPIGNPKAAELGGRPGTLVPSAPRWMTGALRSLRRHARDLPYDVTFEATHHGPYLEAPTFFIEQGSTEREWADLEASTAIARSLLSMEAADGPIAIGLGGGHYVPRQSDLAKAYRIAFGHLLASYALESAAPDIIDRAVEMTADASLAYLHRKSLGKVETRELEAALGRRGLRVVREADLLPEPADKGS